MEILKDKNNGKELFSTVYNIKLIDDVIYEVEGKTTIRSDDASNVNTGANASAEEATEESETAVVRGPDFVINGQLLKLESPLSKKQYQLYLKNHYFKTLTTLSGDKQKKLKAYLDTVWPKFKEFDQYVGQEQVVDPDDGKVPMICLLNYREDTDNPYMICFKDGLEAEKV